MYSTSPKDSQNMCAKDNTKSQYWMPHRIFQLTNKKSKKTKQNNWENRPRIINVPSENADYSAAMQRTSHM